jgi:2-polyprenyl-3-methyl-5-hydroxy-6-metoxy-1,4-benzoquinol methylase
MNTLLAQYEKKASIYFEYDRPEMLSLIPKSARRVLDVGCGSGRFGQLVKRERGVEVWGIEPATRASQEAVDVLDRAFQGEFGPGIPLPEKFFDVVVFNDVLEHMPDPWAALTLARDHLTPEGAVVASIPSIRHFPTLWRLVARKEWRYKDSGTLDRTHLRFFTRQTIEEMFTTTGYEICQIEGLHPFHGGNDDDQLWRYFKVLNLLTFGFISDMKYLQYGVRAKPITPAKHH